MFGVSIKSGTIHYYFHHNVMTVDNGLFTGASDKRQGRRNLKVMLNSHPIGFIGADNIGIDQLLKVIPGASNNNSHGTYPFPGIWKSIGPFGSTERIHDKGTSLVKMVEKKSLCESNPKDYWLCYTKDDIEIIPDWELIKDSITKKENSAIRLKWYWLVLPIRWGFPVVKSLGTDIVKIRHADLGNIAPVGPTFNSGWNRYGATRGYSEYDPVVVNIMQRLGIQETFRNSWGLGNLFFPILLYTPGLNNIANIFYTFLGEEIYRPASTENRRLLSWQVKTNIGLESDDFANLLPQNESQIIADFLSENPDVKIDSDSYSTNPTFGLASDFNLHLGSHISSATSFSFMVTSGLSYNLINGQQESTGSVKAASFAHLSITGDLQYHTKPLINQRLRVTVRGGYGWNWYLIQGINAKLAGRSFRINSTTFGPSLFPNSWQFGGGLDITLKKGGLGNSLSLILDYALYLHRIPGRGLPHKITVKEKVISLGISLNYGLDDPFFWSNL